MKSAFSDPRLSIVSMQRDAVPPRSRCTFVELLCGCLMSQDGWVTPSTTPHRPACSARAGLTLSILAAIAIAVALSRHSASLGHRARVTSV